MEKRESVLALSLLLLRVIRNTTLRLYQDIFDIQPENSDTSSITHIVQYKTFSTLVKI